MHNGLKGRRTVGQMKKKKLTPMDSAHKFAQDLATSLRLQVTLNEIDAMSPEELAKPENQVIIELLIKAIMMTRGSDPIEA